MPHTFKKSGPSYQTYIHIEKSQMFRVCGARFARPDYFTILIAVFSVAMATYNPTCAY